MSTTPLISTVPARPPVATILENLTIPSQDLGVPEALLLHTPYSVISDSTPVPVLALATEGITLGSPSPSPTQKPKQPETPPPELEGIAAILQLNPQTLFPTRDEILAPPSDMHLLPPNPRLALLDNNDPIDYNRVAPVEADDHDPNDPGIPFFPNTPDQPTYFPLLIGDGPEKEVAKYIYYQKDYQEVIGTMARGQPCYGCSVYLAPRYTREMPQHITDNMVNMFHPHDPRRIVIDKVLVELCQPRLRAEISRLRDCLIEKDAVEQRAREVRRLKDKLIADCFHLEMRLGGVRKRLQYARAIPLISEKYMELTTKPTRPRFDASMPFVPREGGPCEMPQVHGEKDKWHLNYPLDATCHRVFLYHNERVAKPFHQIYIVDHESWDELKVVRYLPIYLPLGDDLHGYLGPEDRLFPRPVDIHTTSANRNYYLPRGSAHQYA
ncbi:hypothetical protein EDB85DRAFT_2138613 [Lactarius pseudohatsudake]|nr:hypothetical protein EDB85DRAFT_2138613 [Lactarius pseudohatsudake]